MGYAVPMETEGLFDILNGVYTDVLITDGAGVVTLVAPSFERFYGVGEADVVGRSVYELEAAGVFRPSVTAMVLKSGEPVMTTQWTRGDHEVVVSAIPIKDERGRIVSVISYSRDVTELFRLKEEYRSLQERLAAAAAATAAPQVVAKDPASAAILRTVGQVARFDTSVLLLGESGVGKSLYARMIHEQSGRADGRFVEINCGAIPQTLLESELFGYVGGSFTGARQEGKSGLIETADGGTLFLDEITELPLELQVKLLRVIQNKTILRVGGTKETPVDFRLVSATNKDIAALVEGGLFRNDLYYRLNVVALEIPPLRRRREDIVPLVASAAEQINRQYGMNKEFSKDAYAALTSYDWPGNVRELENQIERLMITTESRVIRARDLPRQLTAFRSAEAEQLDLRGAVDLPEVLDGIERRYYEEALRLTGTTTGAARLLGVSQPTATRKLQKYKARG